MSEPAKPQSQVERRSLEQQQADTRNRMQHIARAIDWRLPRGFGFFVIIFPFGASDGRANYASNARREDVVNVVKEWLLSGGAEEEWMKHIK